MNKTNSPLYRELVVNSPAELEKSAFLALFIRVISTNFAGIQLNTGIRDNGTV